MWQAEFWNRDVKGVYDLTPEPTRFREDAIALDPLRGMLVTQVTSPTRTATHWRRAASPSPGELSPASRPGRSTRSESR